MKRNRLITIIAIAGLILSIAARLIHYNQCLWCDEMEIPFAYFHASWRQLLASGAGECSPNNHVVITILSKLILGLAGHHSIADIARLIRLPSLIAGSLVPLFLAWPFRHRAPLLAILLLVFAAAQPWLIAVSDEARGYALMTLLGIVATTLLPDGKTIWPVGYAIVVALMIYTVPVAGMLLIAHGLTVMILRPEARRAWLRGALVGGGIALLLYLPMARGIWFYMHHPEPAPDSFFDFANQLPRLAFAGEYLPMELEPARHESDRSWGMLIWVAPVLTLVVGSFCGWRQRELRVPMTAMGFATLIFVAAATVIPGAGQARFVPWCAIWLVMAISAIGVEIYHRWKLPAMIGVMFLALGWFGYRDMVLLPSQPIREAIELADRLAPPPVEISVGFLTATDSVRFYGQNAAHHQVLATPGPFAFLQTERDAKQQTGHTPWLIISYEAMVRDTTPRFWDYIQANYECKARLAGRVTPVAIYAPRYP